MTTEALREQVLEVVRELMLAIHTNYQPDENPDFTEAAYDYTDAILSLISAAREGGDSSSVDESGGSPVGATEARYRLESQTDARATLARLAKWPEDVNPAHEWPDLVGRFWAYGAVHQYPWSASATTSFSWDQARAFRLWVINLFRQAAQSSGAPTSQSEAKPSAGNAGLDETNPETAGGGVP